MKMLSMSLFATLFLASLLNVACGTRTTTEDSKQEELFNKVKQRIPTAMPEEEAVKKLSDLAEDDAIMMLGGSSASYYRIIKASGRYRIILDINRGQVLGFVVSKGDNWVKDGSDLTSESRPAIPSSDKWVYFSVLKASKSTSQP